MLIPQVSICSSSTVCSAAREHTPPVAMSSRVDTIALTIANCRFISRPDADFLIVTTKKDLGSWNAYVIRTVNGHRGLFLHAAGLNPETAVSELHTKSAEIALAHITLNGYALDQRSDKKRSSKGASSDHDNPALSDSSLTIDVIDLSASSGCESLSDDETVSIAPGAGDKWTKQKGGKSHKRKESGKGGSDARRSRSRSRSRLTTRSVSRSSASQSRSRSRCGFRSSSTSAESHPVYGPPRPQPMNLMRPMSMRPSNNPPPPPPGYTNWPPHMREVPGPPRMNNPPHHHPHHPSAARPPPLPASSIPTPTSTHPAMTVPPSRPPNGGGGRQQQPQSQPLLHDVLIRIHWPGRGYAQVMKRLAGPTQSALKSAALSHVRRNPQAFGGAKSQDNHALKIMPVGSPGSAYLTAVLHGVSVKRPGGREQVNLQSYEGENLGVLVQELVHGHQHAPSWGGCLLPRFEVEVNSGPPGQQQHDYDHHHPNPRFGVPPKGPTRGTVGSGCE
ncbi:hypothetical protein GE09DRAFT_1274311 [Coniochaeta sp. 2T2.1]|nr:hypothetical protein GE09DRAFT_1274311 [Coniochaeta sp. 2T2.1]